MGKIFTYLLASAVIFIMLISTSFEVKSELDITKNKEFILTFLPNYHNYWYEELFSRSDSIYIFIYAAIPTKGKIEFVDRNGNTQIENFDIPDPNVIYVFKRVARDYALIGYNISGRIRANTDNETIKPYTFKVTADFPIQVYGHSQATNTSESFNVLPMESLGNEYLVLAYNANNESLTSPDGRTPSQFAIVAPEDSTQVTIFPSTRTFENGMDTVTITLNSGEVYLVQTSLDSDFPDLSKSLIKSTKPIAVFSGQQRARVPFDAKVFNASRDYLVEQMPPIDSWSNEAIIVPFPKPSFIESSTQYFDRLRIIASYDNTELLVDDIVMSTLNQGDIFEDNLTNPIHVKANAPIMAAGYKRSSGMGSVNSNLRGDPLLQIIPTPNQYGESYRFIAIQAYERGNKVYTEHFITVIATPENIPTLLLDGNPINPTQFKPVSGSHYRYAHLSINDGTHTIIGEQAFGLFVCGYGYANSYGYFCGVVSKRDDYEPPLLQSSDIDCYEVEGFVTDEKLKSLSAPQNYNQNVIVDIEKFTPFVKEAKFAARLENEYLDGKFRVVAIDSVGQQSYKDFEIPGFTVTVKSKLKNEENTAVNLILDSMGINESRCYKNTIINYGKYNQKVNLAEFLKKYPEITTDLPSEYELKPGDEFEFEICFKSDKVINIIDSLSLKGSCGERIVLALDILVSKDENLPQVAAEKDPCNQFFDITISDSLRTDKGIEKIIVEDSTNLNIVFKTQNAKIYQFKASVINPYKDSHLRIIARDFEGNETIYERFLPGFTVDFSMIETQTDSTMMMNFGDKMIGARYCDSVKLKNYGAYEIIFDDVRIAENIWFSLPTSQLPFILKPNEEISLKVCYFAAKSNDFVMSDTLKMKFNCIDKKVVLSGKADSLIFDGETKCDLPLIFEVSEVPVGAFVGTLYPNPSDGIINVEFNVPEQSLVKIKIFSQLGILNKELNYENLNAGYYKIPVDISNLKSSTYNVVINIGNETFVKSFVLIR
jgi:hypothetical protein